MTNRREFLKSASFMTLGALAATQVSAADGVKSVDGVTAATAQAPKAGTNLGFQAYSLGNELLNNPADALKKMKSYGYDQCELAFYGFDDKAGHGQFASWGGGKPTPAADFKKMADDAGIKIVSSHMTPNLERGAKYDKSTETKILDFWKKIIPDHKMFGVEYIVQPSLPTINNLEDAQAVADIFNKVGALLKENGIKFGYHNHSNEFNKVVAGAKEVTPYYQRGFARPGEPAPKTIEEVFIEGTEAQNVLFELDCYWTVMGQQDPVTWINKYADRIQLLHIKDFVVIGASGAMNFENIFRNFYAHGHRNWFVEIEDINSGKQLDRAWASAQWLKEKGFVK